MHRTPGTRARAPSAVSGFARGDADAHERVERRAGPAVLEDRARELDSRTEIGGEISHDERRGRVQARRCRGSGPRTPRTPCARCRRSRRRRRRRASDRSACAMPNVVRVDVVHLHVAVAELVHGRGGGDRELVEPVVAVEHQRPLRHRASRRAPTTRSAIAGSDTPSTCRRTPAGLASGPRKLNVVGAPSSRRTGAAKRMAGWKRCAKQNPMPASRTHRATPSGPRSITTPSASSTSVEPHCDDDARPPCLATRGTGGGRDDRRHRRHVHRPGAVAPGAARVDGRTVEVSEVDALGELEHRAHEGRELARESRPWPASPPRTRRSGRRSPHRRGWPTSPARPARRAAPRAGCRRPTTSGHSVAVMQRRLPKADRAKRSRHGHRRPGARGRQAVLRRRRTRRRRSRSVSPPHTPCVSRAVTACSRHGSRTGQTSQIAFASSAAVVGIGGRVEELGIGPQAAGVVPPVRSVMMSCRLVSQARTWLRWVFPPATRMRSRTPVPERRLAGTSRGSRRPGAAAEARRMPPVTPGASHTSPDAGREHLGGQELALGLGIRRDPARTAHSPRGLPPARLRRTGRLRAGDPRLRVPARLGGRGAPARRVAGPRPHRAGAHRGAPRVRGRLHVRMEGRRRSRAVRAAGAREHDGRQPAAHRHRVVDGRAARGVAHHVTSHASVATRARSTPTCTSTARTRSRSRSSPSRRSTRSRCRSSARSR